MDKITAILIDDDHDTVEVNSIFLNMCSICIIGTGFNGQDAVVHALNAFLSSLQMQVFSGYAFSYSLNHWI